MALRLFDHRQGMPLFLLRAGNALIFITGRECLHFYYGQGMPSFLLWAGNAFIFIMGRACPAPTAIITIDPLIP